MAPSPPTSTALPLSRVDAPTARLPPGCRLERPYADGHPAMRAVDEGTARHVLYELRDQIRGIDPPLNWAELGPEKWFGAVYYAVVPVKRGGKTWYTPLGWKGHSRAETRKVIEVLKLPRCKPVSAPRSSVRPHEAAARGVPPRLPGDHGAAPSARRGPHRAGPPGPLRADLEGQYAFYGPDLSYDAYQWDGRRWMFERDVDAKDLGARRQPRTPPKAPGP